VGGGRRLPAGAVSGAGFEASPVGAFGERLATKSVGALGGGEAPAPLDFYVDAARSIVGAVSSASSSAGLAADATIDFEKSVTRAVGVAEPDVGRAPSEEGVLVPPRVPAWPTPLDVSMQQVVNFPALSLAECIAQSLMESNVDIAFDKERCQFNCVVFNQGVDSEFRVFLYSLNDPDDAADDVLRTGVEFQRRSGDSYLYHAVKAKVWEDVDLRFEGHQSRSNYVRDIVADKPEKYTGPSLPASAFDFSSIPIPEPIVMGGADAADAAADDDVLLEPPTPTEVDDTTRMLSSLLNAKDESVRAQGVRTAAVATTEDALRDDLIKADLVKPLSLALAGTEDGSEPEHGGDIKTRAFAATALANITDNKKTHSFVADDAVVRTLVRVVAQEHDEETAQLRREATRVLANLATSMPDMLKEAGAAESVGALLADPALAHDSRLQTHAAKAEALLA